VIAVPATGGDFVEAAGDLVQPDDEKTAFTETPPKPASPSPWEKKSEDRISSRPEAEMIPEPRSERTRRRFDEYDDDNDLDLRRLRRHQEAHRGITILVLGIVTILSACLCPLLAWILASIAVRMANQDLAKMNNGSMDPEGRSLVTAGKACAIIGTILGVINAFLGAMIRMRNL
jgi:hypothetical protein